MQRQLMREPMTRDQTIDPYVDIVSFFSAYIGRIGLVVRHFCVRLFLEAEKRAQQNLEYQVIFFALVFVFACFFLLLRLAS
jgi:hypothetical protein